MSAAPRAEHRSAATTTPLPTRCSSRTVSGGSNLVRTWRFGV